MEVNEYTEEEWNDYYESEEWKSYLDWINKLKSKTLKDYREFRRYSDMPYRHIKEELSCMDEITSIGFISGFVPTKRYKKEVFQIKDEDSVRLLEELGDLQNNEWFQHAYFDKQWNAFDLPIPNGYNEEEWDTQTYEWDEFIAQRSDYWGDSYYGYMAIPMKDGRYWLLYYKC